MFRVPGAWESRGGARRCLAGMLAWWRWVAVRGDTFTYEQIADGCRGPMRIADY
jgi:hypothetical protein